MQPMVSIWQYHFISHRFSQSKPNRGCEFFFQIHFHDSTLDKEAVRLHQVVSKVKWVVLAVVTNT